MRLVEPKITVNMLTNLEQEKSQSEAKRKDALAAPTGSVRRIVVTQNMVNEIVRRAKDSQWGLSEEAKASLSLLFYEAAPMDALALVLVNGWESKYDLVSIFSAALSVVEEQAQNDKLTQDAP